MTEKKFFLYIRFGLGVYIVHAKDGIFAIFSALATGVFRKNALGVLSENRFLTFVFLVQKNAPGRSIRKKKFKLQTILNFVLVFVLAN